MSSEFWNKRRVFVTGHTGFKGAWLCLLLRRLDAVVAGYALAPPTTPSLFEAAEVGAVVDSTTADVRDLEALSAAVAAFRPDVILHMAAQSVVLESYSDPVGTYSANVLGTVHVLEAVRRAGRGVAVVNVTTNKVYENRHWVWSYRENDPLGGRDPYSSSKACAELVAQSYRESFFPVADLERHRVALGSARAGNVIGGGDWTPHQLVPETVAALSAGRSVILRHPEAVRPWQHVLDCLTGYLTLAQALVTAPTESSGEWNFGPSSGDVFTVARVVERLGRHWRAAPNWERAEGPRPHEEMELRLDSSKAAHQLGWKCRLAVDEAIDWTARWYRGLQEGRSARDLCEAQIGEFLDR